MFGSRIFPDKPITRKPAEVRMGKGKGNPEYWAAVVEPGRILFEADGVTEAVAKEALELAAQKLPIKTKFIVRTIVYYCKLLEFKLSKFEIMKCQRKLIL